MLISPGLVGDNTNKGERNQVRDKLFPMPAGRRDDTRASICGKKFEVIVKVDGSSYIA